MRKLLLLFGLALFTGIAQAQPVGTECWPVTPGTGSNNQFLCVNQLRNGEGIALTSGSGAATSIGTQAMGILMWTGTAPTTWTVTLPNPAFDGQIFAIGTDTTLTTMVTVQAASAPQNQTLSATFSAQTLSAGASAEWRYSITNTKWYRLR